MMQKYHVYILVNERNTLLHVGMTGDLARRMDEHRQGVIDGRARDFNLNKLVYLETFSDVLQAIARERQLKAWKRSWKMSLIQLDNPDFRDLTEDLLTTDPV